MGKLVENMRADGQQFRFMPPIPFLEELDCLLPGRYWAVQPLLKDETSLVMNKEDMLQSIGFVVGFCFVPDEWQDK
jgi:hypothetical protein